MLNLIRIKWWSLRVARTAEVCDLTCASRPCLDEFEICTHSNGAKRLSLKKTNNTVATRSIKTILDLELFVSYENPQRVIEEAAMASTVSDVSDQLVLIFFIDISHVWKELWAEIKFGAETQFDVQRGLRAE